MFYFLGYHLYFFPNLKIGQKLLKIKWVDFFQEKKLKFVVIKYLKNN